MLNACITKAWWKGYDSGGIAINSMDQEKKRKNRAGIGKTSCENLKIFLKASLIPRSWSKSLLWKGIHAKIINERSSQRFLRSWLDILREYISCLLKVCMKFIRSLYEVHKKFVRSSQNFGKKLTRSL